MRFMPLTLLSIRSEGLEVHARKDKILDSLKRYDDGIIDYSNGVAGTKEMVDDYRFRFVEVRV
jgi:hypothetical protein